MDDLRMRLRHGYETHYETEDFELLCYEAMVPKESAFFLLEGHIDGVPEDAITRLQTLAEKCRLIGVEFSGEYEEVDEDGNSLSREKSIT
ncbi:hypothetical protein [Nocardia transvalensis]|uniref:hypothetical protein n=1 Tax=Nocardia transvalensis TaxID=37333 RepID=UPI001895D855|nr:hypothetical protein [Nocardia transvalensis]MBF6332783.1 hypothetical protein [Nocardia transvalensis]